MTMTTRTWLHGLGAAFIGGGASAVTGAFTAGVIAPQSFNMGDQLGNSVKLMVTAFCFNGLITTFAYLKQSPLPNGEDTAFIPKP